MQLSSIIPFAMLLATAAADLHASCVCNMNGHYNTYLTFTACDRYAGADYPWGGTSYDSATGRCKAKAGAQIGGNEWESKCKDMAVNYSYQCGDGECKADPKQVRGDC